MKKIVLIIFVIFLFTSCQAPTSAIFIENKSNYPATLKIEHIKENKNNVILQPTEGITLSLIAPNTIKYAVSLESISRNYLKFISDNYCVIENIVSEKYTIINTTRFKVILTEKNNLFDNTTICLRFGLHSPAPKLKALPFAPPYFVDRLRQAALAARIFLLHLKPRFR